MADTNITWLHCEDKAARHSNHLRLVVLDYYKLRLDSPSADIILRDLIKVRQKTYLRTAEDFLILDGHDMIGTHFLMYDLSQPFMPRLVAGIRLTYLDRSKEHNLSLPVENLIPSVGKDARLVLEKFKRNNPRLAQCNTLFIEPDYTLSRSGLHISEILFFTFSTYMQRLGINQYVLATNDVLKTGRWVERSCNYEKSYTFEHPGVHQPHTLTFVSSLKQEWLRWCFEAYKSYWENAFEIIPPELQVASVLEAKDMIFGLSDQKKSAA